jgi:hypothetical protein
MSNVMIGAVKYKQRNREGVTFVIRNIEKPKSVEKGGIQNMYRGAYNRIWDIMNENSIFIENNPDGERLIKNDFYVHYPSMPDDDQLKRISRMRNVDIYENR